jgi:hypothetical protein
MHWTPWRKIADRWLWYTDGLTYDGPSCYELGTRGPRGGGIRRHYCGDAQNERARISAYARHGSHLGQIIASHLNGGRALYCRSIACATSVEAAALQDALLSRNRYDWNIQGGSSGFAALSRQSLVHFRR